MNSRECRNTRQEIEQSKLHQRLSGPAVRHIDSCPACREFEIERTRLRELIGSLEPVAAPGDFDARLRARIAADRQQSSRGSFSNRFVLSTPAIAAAAVIVMLAGAIFWLAQHQRNQQSTIASGAPARTEQTITPSDKRADSTDANLPTAPAAANPPVTLTAQAPRDRSPYRDTSGRSGGARGPIEPATDFNVSGAESIRQGEQQTGEVSLSAPVKPLVVSLEDVSGTKRRISLPPVSFGSQRLVDNRLPVSSTNSRSW
ncbi:MAG TPA: hypothetical protein VEM96_10885 [Pyrinomonadaceae bacterium]|nr:hypothetical protein [Pyrinomonadaceae bacterium]